MNPITIPMMTKQSQPVLTTVLLVVVIVLIGVVCYLLACHQHGARKRKKAGQSNHTGHHGNH